MATFVFEKGAIPAQHLAESIRGEMKPQHGELNGSGDCLRFDGRIVAIIHENTVPGSVIFVDKDDNLPIIEAARKVTFLKELQATD
jgi:hypothetical protein